MGKVASQRAERDVTSAALLPLAIRGLGYAKRARAALKIVYQHRARTGNDVSNMAVVELRSLRMSIVKNICLTGVATFNNRFYSNRVVTTI